MQPGFSAQIAHRICAAWAMARQALGRDRILHVFGRAALLRRPKVQGRAAALPYQEGEALCHAPGKLCANAKLSQWTRDWGRDLLIVANELQLKLKEGDVAPSFTAATNGDGRINDCEKQPMLSFCAIRASFAQSSATFARLYSCFE